MAQRACGIKGGSKPIEMNEDRAQAIEREGFVAGMAQDADVGVDGVNPYATEPEQTLWSRGFDSGYARRYARLPAVSSVLESALEVGLIHRGNTTWVALGIAQAEVDETTGAILLGQGDAEELAKVLKLYAKLGKL